MDLKNDVIQVLVKKWNYEVSKKNKTNYVNADEIELYLEEEKETGLHEGDLNLKLIDQGLMPGTVKLISELLKMLKSLHGHVPSRASELGLPVAVRLQELLRQLADVEDVGFALGVQSTDEAQFQGYQRDGTQTSGHESENSATQPMAAPAERQIESGSEESDTDDSFPLSLSEDIAVGTPTQEVDGSPKEQNESELANSNIGEMDTLIRSLLRKWFYLYLSVRKNQNNCTSSHDVTPSHIKHFLEEQETAVYECFFYQQLINQNLAPKMVHRICKVLSQLKKLHQLLQNQNATTSGGQPNVAVMEAKKRVRSLLNQIPSLEDQVNRPVRDAIRSRSQSEKPSTRSQASNNQKAERTEQKPTLDVWDVPPERDVSPESEVPSTSSQASNNQETGRMKQKDVPPKRDVSLESEVPSTSSQALVVNQETVRMEQKVSPELETPSSGARASSNQESKRTEQKTIEPDVSTSSSRNSLPKPSVSSNAQHETNEADLCFGRYVASELQRIPDSEHKEMSRMKIMEIVMKLKYSKS